MTVYLTIGAPASGKSTWAKAQVLAHENSTIVCRDDIRISHGFSHGENEKLVTKVHRTQLEAAFLSGMDVYVADTNLDKQFRKHLVKFCHEHNQEVRLVPFHVELDELIRRDSNREASVGSAVVKKFYDRMNAIPAEPWTEEPVSFSQYKHDESKPPAIIVDIDGTVAKMVGRSPYDYSKVLSDQPIDDVVEVVNALSALYDVVFVSGRPDSCREDTEEWLERFVVANPPLFMRKAGDQRPDYIVKGEIYDECVIPNYNIVMVFDDRDQVVRHVRARGITVAQVAPGNF